MINTKRPNTNDYTQVGFIEAKDGQGNYQNIDHIYDSEGNIVFQQGYLNEYDGADNFRIPAIGKPLIDYTIYGNTFQDGIPTPDNSIMPQGTGERTGNLFDGQTEAGIYLAANGRKYGNYTNGMRSANKIPVSSETAYTLSCHSDNQISLRILEWNGGTFVTQTPKYNITGDVYITVTTNASTTQIAFNIEGENGQYAKNIMLSTGSTPLPYEPYGYKIPISSANTTTPVYLGEVETTRKIKKLVLTGEENITSGHLDVNLFNIPVSDYLKQSAITCVSTHYISQSNVNGWADVNDKSATFYGNTGSATKIMYIRDSAYTTVADFKTYLQQQYAAGTPVTIWYVLATEETAVVNEPLMRIGDYADKLSMEQAGVEIPTLKRPNTTVIDITTSLPPSEVYAKYRGSKTQKYDLFLAANGDSFEAKNGQSLYIGDDT